MCGRREKQESAGRAESVGEGEKAHSRDDTVVLPRQTRDERGRSVRGVQSAHSICALPPRKVPLQGQQAILLILQDSLLQAVDAAEDKGCYEVGGTENDIHSPRVCDGARLSDDKLQKEIKKRGKGEIGCLIKNS